MPQPHEIYNTNLIGPAKIVAFHIETGETRPYNIYEEVGTIPLSHTDVRTISWIASVLKLLKQKKGVRKMRMTQSMYNLNFTRTGIYKNKGYQTYLQRHPQLHEMNHL